MVTHARALNGDLARPAMYDRVFEEVQKEFHQADIMTDAVFFALKVKTDCFSFKRKSRTVKGRARQLLKVYIV